jgi:lipid A ethanolaminephosphotransferase
MVLWAGANNTQLDPQQLQQYQDEELSHDHLFHTLLGLFQIQTAIYQPDLDLLNIN